MRLTDREIDTIIAKENMETKIEKGKEYYVSIKMRCFFEFGHDPVYEMKLEQIHIEDDLIMLELSDDNTAALVFIEDVFEHNSQGRKDAIAAYNERMRIRMDKIKEEIPTDITKIMYYLACGESKQSPKRDELLVAIVEKLSGNIVRNFYKLATEVKREDFFFYQILVKNEDGENKGIG